MLLRAQDDKIVHVSRGLVYKDMGNYQLAIQDFQRSIEIDPKLSEGYFYRGLCKLATKQFKEAIDDFKESSYRIIDEEEHVQNQKLNISAGI